MHTLGPVENQGGRPLRRLLHRRFLRILSSSSSCPCSLYLSCSLSFPPFIAEKIFVTPTPFDSPPIKQRSLLTPNSLLSVFKYPAYWGRGGSKFQNIEKIPSPWRP